MPPFLYGKQEQKKGRYQEQVIKSCKVEEQVRKTINLKSDDMTILACKTFSRYFLTHPVACKGQQVPENNKPQEPPEFTPAWSTHAKFTEAQEQNNHSQGKEEVPELV
ncbi:MAG: hypothetical protein KKI15_01400 [Proteobacteria bacterium]|nr:hypothetical protein [Pseudomonadota bacterium]